MLGGIADFIRYVELRWHRPSTLVVALLVIALAFTLPSATSISLTRGIVLATILLAIAVVWIVTNRVPRAREHSVGFAVAFTAETQEQRDRIVSDMVSHLRDLLSSGQQVHPFTLVVLPDHHAREIVNPDDARAYLARTRCHFIVYGSARMRRLDGADHHVLRMHGAVSHAPIADHIARQFSLEFGELLPGHSGHLIISQENDLFSFEFTSRVINIVAKYIIGIAALLSGDLAYAESLFLETEQLVANVTVELAPLIKIRSRLPSRLAEIYLAHAGREYALWQGDDSSAHLDLMGGYLERLSRIVPHDARAHALRAIWYFLAKRDTASAMREVRRSRTMLDCVWRYSKAFLLAYDGALTKALRDYRIAFRHPCPGGLPLEIEEFILRVLDKEPGKVQLHFCLGAINMFAKGDKARAMQELETFLQLTDVGCFPEERRLARSWVQTMASELSANE